MIEITFNGSHVRTIRSHLDNANDQKQKYGWYKGSNLEGLKISDLTYFSPSIRRNQFRRPNEEKSDIFKPSRFEPLYQPSFGF